MLFLMATVLMLQLQSFQKLFLVVSVAPLGLIGVVVALLPDWYSVGLRRPPGSTGADRNHNS
jgi:multidrug efflux pump